MKFTLISLFNKSHKNLDKIIIIAILLLGFFLRYYNLTGVPYGFHGDEAAIGYNAYTILTKGTDEYGVPFPLFFRSFGEYKSAVEIYSTVPFIIILGLNEFSTRLVSVFYGTLSLIALYFFTLELFKNDKNKKLIAIFSLFFLAISPWDVQFSRVAYELMPFVFFTILGLYLFLKAQYTAKLLPAAILSFILALYSYFTGRLFIPVFGLVIFIFYFKFFYTHKKATIISILLLGILLIPFIQNLSTPAGWVRWEQSSLVYHPPQTESVTQAVMQNYANHFSLKFLFLQGDSAMPGNRILRDAIKGMGELYLFQLPLILLGLYVLFRQHFKRKDNAIKIILLLLILYPLGGMFAADGNPFARRSIIGVIPFQILTGLGTVYLLQIFTKMKRTYSMICIAIVVVSIVISFIYYLQLYFIAYPKYSSSWWGWQYGPRDIISYYLDHRSQYDELIMPYVFNGPYEFYKFYAPNKCFNCLIGLPDNYYTSYSKQLFALTPDYFASHTMYSYKILKTLYYPNGTKAFVLTELTKKKME